MSADRPSEGLDAFGALLGTSTLRLVCDTNVYLDAREAIGVEADGRLRIIIGPAKESPAVAVLRAPSIVGVTTQFIFAQPVASELYKLVKEGYPQRPTGLGDPPRTAAAVRNLMGLHPLGHVVQGGRTYLAPLPDPPLSAAERNDRHIWSQALVTGAVLVTSDQRLLQAVRLSTASPISALEPVELIDLAAAYAASLEES